MSIASYDEAFAEKQRGPSRIIWMIALVAVVFVVWASMAWLDEIVHAQGEVVSSSRPQIIQNRPAHALLKGLHRLAQSLRQAVEQGIGDPAAVVFDQVQIAGRNPHQRGQIGLPHPKRHAPLSQSGPGQGGHRHRRTPFVN